jgi:hypothetical protein
LAVANYEDTNGHLPPAYVADENGRPMHSWRVLLLPYLDQGELFDRYNLDEPWDSPANRQLAGQMPRVYAFHGGDEPGMVTTNYLAVVGDETAWPGSSGRRYEDVSDDRASTILVVENAGRNIHWMEPRDLEFESMSLQVNDPQGLSSKYLDPAVAMLDGSLRRISETLPEEVFRALLTADGGEPLTSTGGSWQLLPDGRQRAERERH